MNIVKELPMTSLFVFCIAVVAVFAVYSLHNPIPIGTVTGMTSSGVEVDVLEVCVKGHLYLQHLGAEIDDWGAPVPCVFGRGE